MDYRHIFINGKLEKRVLTQIPLTILPFNQEQGNAVTHMNLVLDGTLPPTDTVAIIVDLETTGLYFKDCEAIELGMVKVGISNGKIREVISVLAMMQEPRNPLSEEITQITGITSEDVKGRSFEVDVVNDFIKGADLFIAHNAAFDRPFFERDVTLTDEVWACSSKGGEIDWKKLGYPKAGLEDINYRLGYFYEAHRAVIDCLATAWMLIREPLALESLLANKDSVQSKVQAWGSPFSAKDDLKARKYQWNATDKVWEKTFLSDDDAKAEIEQLEQLVYRGARRSAEIVRKNAIEKYSDAE